LFELTNGAWFKARNGTLQYSCALQRPDRYLHWTASEGSRVVKALAAQRRFSLFGAERAVVRQLWKELRQAAETMPLADMIAREAAAYVRRFARLAEECTSLPRSFPNLRRLVAVPRVLCYAETLEGVFERFGAASELVALRGGQPFREFFYRELVAQLDAALLAASPTLRRPVVARNEWLVVGADVAFEWAVPLKSGPAWHGHYFLYESPPGGLTWKTRREMKKVCETLHAEILNLTREQRNEIVRAARLRPGSSLSTGSLLSA